MPGMPIVTNDMLTQILSFLEENDRYITHDFYVEADDTVYTFDHTLRFESLWLLTNLIESNSDYTNFILQNNGIKLLTDLFSNTDDPHVTEQIIWTMGNLAGDSILARTHIIESGFMESIFHFTSTEYLSEELRQTLAWAMSNFSPGCLTKYNTYYAIGILSCLLSNYEKNDRTDSVIEDCCNALVLMFKNTCQDSQSITIKDGKQIYEGFLYQLIQESNLHQFLIQNVMKLKENPQIMVHIKNMILKYVHFSFETDEGKQTFFENLQLTNEKD
jgi:hypothetical protein